MCIQGLDKVALAQSQQVTHTTVAGRDQLFQVKGMMGETVRAKQNQVKSRSRRAVSEHQSKEKIVCQMQLKEGRVRDGGVTF